MNLFTAKCKKGVSLLLSLIMLLSAVYVAGAAFTVEVQAQTPAAAETVTTVVACSDYQYRNNDVYSVGATGNAGGEIVVGSIVSQMQADGVAAADGFLVCGDYDYDLGSGADAAGGIVSLKRAVSPIAGSAETVLVQGNHDPQSTAGGTSPSGDNDPDSGAYGVFVINERDYQWRSNGLHQESTLAIAEQLRRYFNYKIAVDYTAPIFVLSHLPLHYSMRSREGTGENLYARDVFDVLNEAGAQGLNIIFLYGHNHTNGWDDYLGGSKVFLTKGSDINIAGHYDANNHYVYTKDDFTVNTLNFTYMNPGFTGHYERWNTATGDGTTATASSSASFNRTDLTMTRFDITGSDVTITRYDYQGATVLKQPGVRNQYKNETAYGPNRAEVNSPYTLSLTSP